MRREQGTAPRGKIRVVGSSLTNYHPLQHRTQHFNPSLAVFSVSIDDEVSPIDIKAVIQDDRNGADDRIASAGIIVSVQPGLLAVADTSPYSSSIGIVRVSAESLDAKEDEVILTTFDQIVTAPITLPVAASVKAMAVCDRWLAVSWRSGPVVVFDVSAETTVTPIHILKHDDVSSIVLHPNLQQNSGHLIRAKDGATTAYTASRGDVMAWVVPPL